jgi:hypothetical protein
LKASPGSGAANGTATTSDSDYIAKTGTLTFAPGETTKTINIEVKGDSKKEANETFYLDLFDNSLNSLFTKNRGLGTILNDDRATASEPPAGAGSSIRRRGTTPSSPRPATRASRIAWTCSRRSHTRWGTCSATTMMRAA